MKKTLIATLLVTAAWHSKAQESWIIDSSLQWQSETKQRDNLSFNDNSAIMTDKLASFRSVVKQFPTKRQAKSIVFEQTADWQNWQAIENIGPSNLLDAPVFLRQGANNYWLFGRYGDVEKRQNFKAQDTKLLGFEIELKTTPFANQFDAQGGLKPSLDGYHAWQSRDMENWVHHGPVTEEFSRWVTSAEYIDGKTYLLYDYPNDQDPHLYIDDDLTDGVPGENKGMIFKDPSHGSDTAFFRESDGSLHIIYEDWSPIHAANHAWDSPLAGHAVSYDGYDNFQIVAPAVDLRTTPTGKTKTYKHPYWAKHPDWDTNIGEYQEHLPIQDAFGDWCMIKIGSQYYLFGDYDHAENSVSNGNPRNEAQANMTIARFTTDDLNKEFTLVGDYGATGHPDPDIGFAEGKFYLITQAKDFVSSGPWIDTVSARAGVDIDNDGKIDEWTKWQKVTETYQQKEGFAKHVERIPAQLDLTELPSGYGFSFEFKTRTDANGFNPKIDAVTLTF